jgi:hypothetical protein
MQMMLSSELMKGLLLKALALDIWHIRTKTNNGTIGVDFADSKMNIILCELDSEFGAMLINAGYQVVAKPQESEYNIELILDNTKPKPNNYRVKSFKKFLKLLKKHERIDSKKERLENK